MKSNIRHEGDLTIVELSGYLDFESSSPLKNSIGNIYNSNNSAQIIIDLHELEFVGSSGVSSFVKAMKIFNRLKMKPFYYGVKSEFVRLFRAFEEDTPFDVRENKEAAVLASLERYKLWEMETLRSKSTH